ncbi:MAG: NUDIX hydrolase [Candidatus Absconditabacterales bacterium]
MTKIPAHAKIVYDGLIYQVYQRDQTMFDGSIRTFEEIKRPSSVFALPIVDRKIVVSYQKQPGRTEPYWSLIGGRLDGDEEPLAGAKREMLEETGMQANHWSLLFDKKTPVINWKLYYYVAKGCTKIQDPIESSGESIKLFYLDFEVFVEMALQGVFANDPLKDYVHDMVRNKKLKTFEDILFTVE